MFRMWPVRAASGRGDHLETPNINESFANTYGLEFILGYCL